MINADYKQTKVWALVLLVLANASAGGIVYYGIRSHFAPMLILGVVGSIFNVLLFVCALIEPLNSNRGLRDALLWFFFENCFFVGAIFASVGDHFAIAGLSAVVGVAIHFLISHGRVRRLVRRRDRCV
jgi:hypothetical protein